MRTHCTSQPYGTRFGICPTSTALNSQFGVRISQIVTGHIRNLLRPAASIFMQKYGAIFLYFYDHYQSSFRFRLFLNHTHSLLFHVV